MSCHNQGTAAAPEPWTDLGEAGSGSNTGFIHVAPEEFTRKELQAIRDKARNLLVWTSPSAFDLLEDLADTLDLLDALAAREEADLAELEETVAEHMKSGGTAIAPLPSCGPCPLHPRMYGHGVGD